MKSFNEWERALLTYDAEVIRATAAKYRVNMPTDKRLFWLSVAAAILRIKNANAFERETAYNIMREARNIPTETKDIGTPFRETTEEGTFANALDNGMTHHAILKPHLLRISQINTQNEISAEM